MKLGFIVNPVAGMGGSVGLKGTDGTAILARARELGAQPLAHLRALRTLEQLNDVKQHLEWITPEGEMGGDVLKAAGFHPLLTDITNTPSAEATRAAAKAFCDQGVDLILFVGGDGTARDIVGAVGLSTPILGIPAGVKMHSAVFGKTPHAVGYLIQHLIRDKGCVARIAKREVLDIDEDELRAGRVSTRLFGYANVPVERNLIQSSKSSGIGAEEPMLRALGAEIAKEMRPGTTYFFGPGTTAKRPLDALDIQGTLLGIDAVRDGQLIGTDLTNEQIRNLASEEPYVIVIGVTGGQGFLFGRGNQQICAQLIDHAWSNNLIIVASTEKLATLSPPRLVLDTGDIYVDQKLRGFARVRTGPQRSMMMQLE